MTEPIHKQCTAHSGVDARNKVIIWMLGILITVVGGVGIVQNNTLSAISAQGAVNAYQNINFTGEVLELKVELKSLKRRMRTIEKGPQ